MIEKIKIGTAQYKTSASISKNLEKIESFIKEAAEKKVRLLLFQECSLCGYPPIEISNIDEIDFNEQSKALEAIERLAIKNNMYIAVGYIHNENNTYYNTMKLISPNNEKLEVYHKRALWGWDTDNFEYGTNKGIYEIDGIKIGTRICFEIRFPELFKELYSHKVEICLLSLCDVQESENKMRRKIIQSHMITRAVENVMYLVTSNSISGYPTAPTCFISPSGQVLLDAGNSEETLIVNDIEITEPNFGQRGIQFNKDRL